jgi:hypothetical protein
MTAHKNGNDIIEAWLQSANIFPAIGGEPYPFKKIIDGKTYNTETSTLIARYTFDKCFEDYLHQYEWLYQTRGGKFFLAGEGWSGYTPFGALLPGTNERIRGHVLLPLDVSQVRKWLEIRDCIDEFESVFGEQEDAFDEKQSTSKSENYSMTLRLPLLLAQKIKLLCLDKESVQSFIHKAIEVECIRRDSSLANGVVK